MRSSSSSGLGEKAALTLMQEDLPPEVFESIKREVKKQKLSKVDHIVSVSEDYLRSVINQENLSIAEFSQLTDWQIWFVYIVPRWKKTIYEVEMIEKAEKDSESSRGSI